MKHRKIALARQEKNHNTDTLIPSAHMYLSSTWAFPLVASHVIIVASPEVVKRLSIQIVLPVPSHNLTAGGEPHLLT